MEPISSVGYELSGLHVTVSSYKVQHSKQFHGCAVVFITT